MLGLSRHTVIHVPRKVYSAQFIGCLGCARLESENTEKTEVTPTGISQSSDLYATWADCFFLHEAQLRQDTA